MEKFLITIFLFTISGEHCVFAKDLFVPKSNSVSSAKSGVVELDAEVIEGEARRPLIFLEFDKHSQTLDSIIFQRLDFNDFRRSHTNTYFKYLPGK